MPYESLVHVISAFRGDRDNILLLVRKREDGAHRFVVDIRQRDTNEFVARRTWRLDRDAADEAATAFAEECYFRGADRMRPCDIQMMREECITIVDRLDPILSAA